MDELSLDWKSISSVKEFNEILERSRTKPALLFKYSPSSTESIEIKASLEANWTIEPEMLDLYLVDIHQDREVSTEATNLAGVPDEHPQILLYADGVTMYDESHELINVKKIKIALKIINRTFRWLETRV